LILRFGLRHPKDSAEYSAGISPDFEKRATNRWSGFRGVFGFVIFFKQFPGAAF
jgi:hypothetical protein